MSLVRRHLTWTTLAPIAAIVALLASWGRDLPLFAVLVVAVLLGAAVLAAVHHAEVVAHKVGEPFGSLVLAVAVTIIEVALIVTLMVSGDPEKNATLARDTVFAAVMITLNLIVGITLFVGISRRSRLAVFNSEGTGAALATVIAIAALSLVIPRFTTTTEGPIFSDTQLVFAAVASLVLYGMFVVTQTARHRDFFLPVEEPRKAKGGSSAAAGSNVPDDEDHAAPPSRSEALVSVLLLAVSLVAVVGLSKVESPAIEAGVKAAGLPPSFVGVIIALVVLLPETLAAARNAKRRRVQIGLNLALGSAMASIGLTIPAMAIMTLFIDTPLVLGLDPVQIVLLALTASVSILTVMPGRATRLQASIHLVLGVAFVFLAAIP
ncbi:calcium:cation antiporter [Mariniluteicoccus flavus]